MFSSVVTCEILNLNYIRWLFLDIILISNLGMPMHIFFPIYIFLLKNSQTYFYIYLIFLFNPTILVVTH